MSLSSRAAESAWFLSGTLATRGFNFLTSFALARILGTQGYGEVALVQATVAASTSLAGGTLGPTATRYVSELRRREKGRAGRFIALIARAGGLAGIAAFAALMWAAPYLAGAQLGDRGLGFLFRIVAICPLALTVCTIGAAVTAGLDAFGARARTETIAAAANFALLAGAALSQSVPAVVIGLAASTLTGAILWTRSAGKACGASGIAVAWSAGWGEWRALRDTALPLFVSGASTSCAAWAVNVILAARGKGYDEVAIYNALVPWTQIIGLVPASLIGTFAPKLPRLVRSPAVSTANSALASHVAFAVAIAIAVAVPLALASNLVAALYGHGFSASGGVLRQVCVLGVLMVPVAALSQICYAMDRSWFVAAASIGWSLALAGGVALVDDVSAAAVASIQNAATASLGLMLAIGLRFFRRRR